MQSKCQAFTGSCQIFILFKRSLLIVIKYSTQPQIIPVVGTYNTLSATSAKR